MPSYGGGIEFSCVDQVADAIVMIFNRSNLMNETFHLYNPHIVPLEQMEKYFNEAGYEVELMEVVEFIQFAMENYERKHQVFDDVFLRYGVFDDKNEPRTTFHILADKSNTVLKKLGFEWLKVNERYLKTMLDYCKSINFIN